MSVCKYRAFMFLDQPPPWVSRIVQNCGNLLYVLFSIFDLFRDEFPIILYTVLRFQSRVSHFPTGFRYSKIFPIKIKKFSMAFCSGFPIILHFQWQVFSLFNQAWVFYILLSYEEFFYSFPIILTSQRWVSHYSSVSGVSLSFFFS